MRIIAGSKRGKKLFEKVDQTTRPTTDRVRENVFNVLDNLIDLKGARVLDLFAGCGAYGLESYSRGAASVIFNDADKQAFEVIKKNCKAIGCGGLVLNLDFRHALEKLNGEQFDIIFLDPPYASDFVEHAIDNIAKQNMVSEGGIIVVETDANKIPLLEKGVTPLEGGGVCDFKVQRVKHYGRAYIYFLTS